MKADDLGAAGPALEQVYGIPAWGAAVGFGSFLTVEFGAPVEAGGKTHGEFHLWVSMAVWRLERDGEVVVSSEDDELGPGVATLDGHSVVRIVVERPSLSATFEFTGGLVLKTFSVYSTDAEHWMLFLRDGRAFTAGPGSAWSLEPAERSAPGAV